MSFARCTLFLAAAVCVQAKWEDYSNYMVGKSTHLQKIHESSNSTEADCKSIAEELDREAVLFANISDSLVMCVVFKDGKSELEELHEEATGYTVSYYYEEQDEEDDDSLSAGEVVATIILAIFYGLCLLVLAFTCKHEEIDIAAQMDNLEKRELEIEEAVSEHFERKSQEYERKSQEAEAKEMAEIQKAEQDQ